VDVGGVAEYSTGPSCLACRRSRTVGERSHRPPRFYARWRFIRCASNSAQSVRRPTVCTVLMDATREQTLGQWGALVDKDRPRHRSGHRHRQLGDHPN
jgi:hypothetical protein